MKPVSARYQKNPNLMSHKDIIGKGGQLLAACCPNRVTRRYRPSGSRSRSTFRPAEAHSFRVPNQGYYYVGTISRFRRLENAALNPGNQAGF
jgi:hypothetical protein